MATNKRCGCPGAKGFCRHHSKVKMVVQIKDQYRKEAQPTFYSFFKEQHHPIKVIVERMLKRLENRFKNEYNCILFYDIHSNQLVHKKFQNT
jgi:hypothetical protein